MRQYKQKEILSVLAVVTLFVLLLLSFIASRQNADFRSRAQVPPSAGLATTPSASANPGAVVRPTAAPNTTAITNTPPAGGTTSGGGSTSGSGSICGDPALICDFDDDGICLAYDEDERTNLLPQLYNKCVFNTSAVDPMCSTCDLKANRDGVFDNDDIGFCKEYCLAQPAPTGPVPPAKPTDVPEPTTPVITPVASRIPTSIPDCATKKSGDCNCDKITDIEDVECFRKQYVGEVACGSSDCSGDNRCSLSDFECIRANLEF